MVLSIGLLTKWQFASPSASGARKCTCPRRKSVLYKLISKVTSQAFCCTLFIKSEEISLVQHLRRLHKAKYQEDHGDGGSIRSLFFLLPCRVQENKINEKGMGKVKCDIILTEPTWVIEKGLRSILGKCYSFILLSRDVP